MNNLVDYGPDSDEESPRRRSSEGQSTAQKFREHQEKLKEERRKRRSSEVFGDDDDDDAPMDISEPPAPKRHDDHSPTPAAFRTPQIGIPHAASTTSLVSYSGDGDDDDDSSELPKLPGFNQSSDLAEPAPPMRQSRDELDEYEEQKLIDAAIREGNEAIMRMNREEGSSPTDTPGHDSVVDSPFSGEVLDGTPSHNSAPPDTPDEREIRIPPAPDVEVNPKLAQVFENAFRQKAQGVDLNQQIQGNSKYNNPMIYTTFIETFNIDEKGTNFAKNIFDPHVFPDNCFYDAIGEEQRKAQEPPKKK